MISVPSRKADFSARGMGDTNYLLIAKNEDWVTK
jgi:hypothetical protein